MLSNRVFIYCWFCLGDLPQRKSANWKLASLKWRRNSRMKGHRTSCCPISAGGSTCRYVGSLNHPRDSSPVSVVALHSSVFVLFIRINDPLDRSRLAYFPCVLALVAPPLKEMGKVVSWHLEKHKATIMYKTINELAKEYLRLFTELCSSYTLKKSSVKTFSAQTKYKLLEAKLLFKGWDLLME